MNTQAQIIESIVADSLRVKSRFFADNRQQILDAVDTIAHGLRNGRKVLLFGNGGSAADSQHLAAELVGRLFNDRAPMAAIALTTDTSILSAVSNDYGYEHVFARQVLALGHAGDIAIAISTSGNAPSVLAGVDAARQKGLVTIGFTGENGGSLNGRTEVLFCVPSRNTQRIQETHIMLGHLICELLDRKLFPENYPQD